MIGESELVPREEPVSQCGLPSSDHIRDSNNQAKTREDERETPQRQCTSTAPPVARQLRMKALQAAKCRSIRLSGLSLISTVRYWYSSGKKSQPPAAFTTWVIPWRRSSGAHAPARTLPMKTFGTTCCMQLACSCSLMPCARQRFALSISAARTTLFHFDRGLLPGQPAPPATAAMTRGGAADRRMFHAQNMIPGRSSTLSPRSPR